MFPQTYFSIDPVQKSAAKKRSVDVESQRVRTQLSVRNRTMPSTPADYDHSVSAREESRHSVIQTTVQLVVILGLHDGLRNSQISTDVSWGSCRCRDHRTSAVDHPCWTTVAYFRVVVFKTANKLVVVCSCVQFIMRTLEFVTTLRRPRRPFKIRESTAYDNRISLEHTPRQFTKAHKNHRKWNNRKNFEWSIWILNNIVNTRFIVKVKDKVIRKRITRTIVAYHTDNSDHEQPNPHLSSNFQW